MYTVVSLTKNACLSGGNCSYIVRLSVRDLHGPTDTNSFKTPLLLQKIANHLKAQVFIILCYIDQKSQGPHDSSVCFSEDTNSQVERDSTLLQNIRKIKILKKARALASIFRRIVFFTITIVSFLHNFW